VKFGKKEAGWIFRLHSGIPKSVLQGSLKRRSARGTEGPQAKEGVAGHNQALPRLSISLTLVRAFFSSLDSLISENILRTALNVLHQLTQSETSFEKVECELAMAGKKPH